MLGLAAEKAGWGRKRPGIAQGLAVVFWAGSFGAMVADVSIQGKMPKVHRVVAAVDCGTVVNPDIVVQQAQSATNYGPSAALTGNITIERGRVQQNNFYDYTVLRMADAPSIEVHVAPSTEKPTGIGELCTPPIAGGRKRSLRLDRQARTDVAVQRRSRLMLVVPREPFWVRYRKSHSIPEETIHVQ